MTERQHMIHTHGNEKCETPYLRQVEIRNALRLHVCHQRPRIVFGRLRIDRRGRCVNNINGGRATQQTMYVNSENVIQKQISLLEKMLPHIE
jgi:hypothetical protein